MEPPDPGTSKAASIATAAASVKAAGPPLVTSKAGGCFSVSPEPAHVPRVVPAPCAPMQTLLARAPPLGAPPLGAPPLRAPPQRVPPPAFAPGPFISGPDPLPVKAPPAGQALDGFSAVKMPPTQFEVVPGGLIGVKMPPPAGPPLMPPAMMSTSLPVLPPGMGLAPPVGPPPAIMLQPPPQPPAGLLAAVDAAVVRAGAPISTLTAARVEWQAHKSSEGLPYFFCKKTGESRWVRPSGPGDVIVEATPKPEPELKATSVKDKLGEPESWESIGKTGWTRVQTDKGYTYFYHKKQKKTSWTCPPEIAKEVAELDGSLGAVDGEESKEQDGEQEGKEGTAGAGEKPDEPAAGEDEAKPTRAERAEKRAQQVEEEQKAAKEKEKLRNFKQLLVEKGVRAFDKYEKWVPKLMHDPRFTAVSGLKERRILFEMLAKRIDTEKRKTQAVCKSRGREAFKELLEKAEELDLLAGRTVEKALASMERRFGDEAQWDAVPERDRERMVSEAVAEATKRAEKQKEEARSKFRALVLEGLKGLKEDEEPPPFSKARRRLEEDPSWSQLASTERENLYNRVAGELKDAKRKQNAKRREVQQELEEARKKRKLSEAEEKIFSVLSERMKNPFSMTWEEAAS